MSKVTIKISGGIGPSIKNELPYKNAVKCIVLINEGLKDFWTNAKGWAPIEAANLLNKSRLDWQISLSNCLYIWEEDSRKDVDGRLILAWANLGSLVEGTMKLFLSVYYNTYKKDIGVIKSKKGNIVDPDICKLERLRQFFNKRVWKNKEKDWDNWILHIQQRRNAIHAYKNRELGNFDEFFTDVGKYLFFLRNINDRLPYPDDIYNPEYHKGIYLIAGKLE